MKNWNNTEYWEILEKIENIVTQVSWPAFSSFKIWCVQNEFFGLDIISCSSSHCFCICAMCYLSQTEAASNLINNFEPQIKIVSDFSDNWICVYFVFGQLLNVRVMSLCTHTK